jgi:hypothetical protein
MAKPTTSIQMLLNALFVILVGFALYKSFAVTGTVTGDDHWKRLTDLEATQRAALTTAEESQGSLAGRQLADTLWQEGNFSEAERLYGEGAKAANPAGYDARFVDKVLKLAAISVDNGDFTDAFHRYELILAYDRKMLGDTSREVARDLNNLGVASYLAAQATKDEKGRKDYFAKACNYYSQAAKITRHLGDDQDTLWRLKRILSNQELANQDMNKANQIPFDRLRSPNNDML